MKYVMIIPDGLADLRINKFNYKTPLDIARIPSVDHILQNGLAGAVKLIPDGQLPGSDIANLSLFGVDPRKRSLGRGALESLARGIKLKENETAFRMNFVSVDNNKMKDYTGGNIKTRDAEGLIKILNKEFKQGVKFYTGVDYRNLAVLPLKNLKIKTVPPHDILDRNITPYLPKGDHSPMILEIMNKAGSIISNSDYFKRKKLKSNSIWLWGQGNVNGSESFYKKYRLKSAVISAVDIIKGIAGYLDMNVIKVPGITGDFYTNYTNKSRYALKALRKYDFVAIHIEAPDEAGHKGDYKEKKESIEKIDRYILKPLLASKLKFNIIFLPDHPTPIKFRTHTGQEVPFVLYSKIRPLPVNHKFKHYSEEIIKHPPIFIKKGDQFLNYVFRIIKKHITKLER